jgi:hypothetical protein
VLRYQYFKGSWNKCAIFKRDEINNNRCTNCSRKFGWLTRFDFLNLKNSFNYVSKYGSIQRYVLGTYKGQVNNDAIAPAPAPANPWRSSFVTRSFTFFFSGIQMYYYENNPRQFNEIRTQRESCFSCLPFKFSLDISIEFFQWESP